MRRQTNATSVILNGDSIAVRQIRPSVNGDIKILGNTIIVPPSVLKTGNLKITNQAQDTGYTIMYDETETNFITIQKFDKENNIYGVGYVYDSLYNRPENTTSQNFELPTYEQDAILYLINNRNGCIVVSCNTHTEFNLPAFATDGSDDTRQIQISNISLFDIHIKFNNEIIIQMFQERITCIWRKQSNGTYMWMYIP